MHITTEQLNQVAALIGTTDRAAVITAVLATLTSAGLAVDAAFEAVFGPGSFQRLAGDLHTALTA